MLFRKTNKQKIEGREFAPVRGWRQYCHVKLRQTFGVGNQRVNCRGEQFNHFWSISGSAGLDPSIKGALQCKTDPVWCVVPVIIDDWIVHHGNAPSHKLLASSEILAKFNLKIAPPAPYNSTSLTFFFLQMKKKKPKKKLISHDSSNSNSIDELS